MTVDGNRGVGATPTGREAPRHKSATRVLLKLSGEVLGAGGHGVDGDELTRLSGEIQRAVASGVQVAIVVGGGNFLRVAQSTGVLSRTTADHMGMLATVMNGVALRDALIGAGVEARVLSALPAGAGVEPADSHQARRHLATGRVVIFAGGTGNPFFSTDTAAGLRAAEVGADILLKGTKVDGVYSGDPATDSRAERLPQLTFDEALERQLEVMDTAAFALCREHAMPLRVFDVRAPGNLERALCGQPVGSRVDPSPRGDDS